MTGCGEWVRVYKVLCSPMCSIEFCYISWLWGMWDFNSPPIFNYFNIYEKGLGLWGPVPVGVRATRYPSFVSFPSF